MIPNNQLKRMWREFVMPKFQVISMLLPGETEEIQGRLMQGEPVCPGQH
jgi:hypothetical protein